MYIKYIIDKNIVTTLVRDDYSKNDGREKKHKLNDNTDFKIIYEKYLKNEKKTAYFFSNNLFKENNYNKYKF